MGMDEEIFGLEAKIIRLKANYEQYFQRVLKREPIKLRKEVEQTILHYTGVPINNTSLKFKFSTLSSRFTTYKQYWRRTLRMIEEGTYQRRAEGGGATLKAELPAEKPPTKATAPPEEAKLKDAFDKYLSSRKDCGESTKGVTFEKFQKNITSKQKKLGMEGKAVKVFVKDGKTKVAFISGRKKKKTGTG
ncbi:hypothetical protein MNBD_DELTA01-803 [hydrothermal vent metagenome]|uniref:Uncharacterized protein n=1 Tax=hydrothermal vent metagenome TaxID=652676 RepID=A0A3B0QV68_9ZZZZ